MGVAWAPESVSVPLLFKAAALLRRIFPKLPWMSTLPALVKIPPEPTLNNPPMFSVPLLAITTLEMVVVGPVFMVTCPGLEEPSPTANLTLLAAVTPVKLAVDVAVPPTCIAGVPPNPVAVVAMDVPLKLAATPST